MMTGCFKWYNGKDGIAICRVPPKSWAGPRYKPLEPTLDMLIRIKSGTITQAEYTSMYIDHVLLSLDPFKVLHDMQGKVALCWERPLFGDGGTIVNSGTGFCHRHIVSEWIRSKTGYGVVEWRPGVNYECTKLF